LFISPRKRRWPFKCSSTTFSGISLCALNSSGVSPYSAKARRKLSPYSERSRRKFCFLILFSITSSIKGFVKNKTAPKMRAEELQTVLSQRAYSSAKAAYIAPSSTDGG